jgi:hypothetical protein
LVAAGSDLPSATQHHLATGVVVTVPLLMAVLIFPAADRGGLTEGGVKLESPRPEVPRL